MNEQTLQDMQMKIAKRHTESQLKIAEMQEAEAIFKAKAAQHIAEREEAITETTKRTHAKLEQQASNCLRPTAMLRPKVERLGTGWSASYGDVRGIGPTPDLACQDFDRMWLGKDEI